MGKAKVVTKAHVAAAKAALLQRNEYPSTPKVRKELANTIHHSGHQNEVSELLKELREEEKAAAKNDDAPSRPAEPLPREIQEVLDEGRAAIGSTFTTLASRVAVTLTTTKADIRKSADEYIVAAMAEAVRRADEAEIESADRGAEIERLDQEVDRLQTLLEQKAAEVPPLKEALVIAQHTISRLEAERDTARKEESAAQVRIKEISGELASECQKAAVITTERNQATKRVTELQAQLEAATEKNGTLAVELSDVKASRAELVGQNTQLVSERDNLREAAKKEREAAEQALQEARTARAELAELTAREATSGEQTGVSAAAPTA